MKTDLHPKYVTDGQGRQTAVILPIEEYSALLEDIDDLATAAFVASQREECGVLTR